MTQTDIIVNGMTCEHCVNAVTQEISAIDGVQSVQINLNAGGDSPVSITSDRPLEAGALAEAVDEAGYTIV
ncbi:heavy-metal-associated domain-containing protein [Rudaeicoccus suwonensis]|uniref:Copper chaperone CopZ n=1 Tax=Rudaeicoccus suwonensis TaxID=657409 RepID=A0A561E6R9_9MICO|nr:heavy-metal-associated domain-containing protein [Rudaeicoccus suwonensis]TWE11292.1 copper chaperone CopZ [Rudaeicoccus suwonensis]